MVATYIKDFAQYDLDEVYVYSRRSLTSFSVSQVSAFVENFNIEIYSDTTSMIYGILCMRALLIELYLFTPLSVIFTIVSNTF